MCVRMHTSMEDIVLALWHKARKKKKTHTTLHLNIKCLTLTTFEEDERSKKRSLVNFHYMWKIRTDTALVYFTAGLCLVITRKSHKSRFSSGNRILEWLHCTGNTGYVCSILRFWYRTDKYLSTPRLFCCQTITLKSGLKVSDPSWRGIQNCSTLPITPKTPINPKFGAAKL